MTEVSLRERLEALRAAGQPLAALDLAIESGGGRTEPWLEPMMVGLRHEAYADLEYPDRVDVEPIGPQEPNGDMVPIAPSELSLDRLRSGIRQHGYVSVKGLIDESTAAMLRDGIDRTLEAFDTRSEGDRTADSTAYFSPFKPTSGDYRIGGRQFMRESGGVWAADSPRMLATVLEVVRETGLDELITAYLGERPVLSANKCNLRRVPVTTATNWHQDGAFLGREVKSLNLWLALGPCGVDAPGLDILPRRLDQIVATGTEGAMFDWSVAPDKVDEVAGDTPIIRPTFEAGDALLFDHLLLHRTGVSPGMTVERHAIETWFFTASSYPQGQIPIVL